MSENKIVAWNIRTIQHFCVQIRAGNHYLYRLFIEEFVRQNYKSLTPGVHPER